MDIPQWNSRAYNNREALYDNKQVDFMMCSEKKHLIAIASF